MIKAVSHAEDAHHLEVSFLTNKVLIQYVTQESVFANLVWRPSQGQTRPGKRSKGIGKGPKALDVHGVDWR